MEFHSTATQYLFVEKDQEENKKKFKECKANIYYSLMKKMFYSFIGKKKKKRRQKEEKEYTIRIINRLGQYNLFFH
jgi:hypothetical protein